MAADDSGAHRVPVAKVRAPRLKSLSRERLDERLAALWDHRLGLVIAPAGSGKTTLLGQFASAADATVAWYRPESGDGSAESLLVHLRRALGSVLGPFADPWPTAAAAAEALDRFADRRLALIVDDLHVLEGSEAEATLEQLLDYLPPSHVVLAASRRPPRFNLSRLRVSGSLLELGADDLRFRSWEVEHLFRNFYAEPLPPEDLAELARRTEGWAAGLQLFHLATRGKVAAERRRVLAALGSRSRLVREYLARNVLDELPDELRNFLLGTCVLGRLSGRLCDELLGIEGSEQLLAELEHRQIFTHALDEDGTYRYHEVLRTHLESMLVERWGRDRVRAEYTRAGRLLEAEGLAPDALRAYCCAEDWEAAARLLGREGEQLVDDAGSWLEGMPPAVVDSDPWLLLATARRYLAAGRLEPAATAYERAEEAFGSMAASVVSRRERLALRAWIDPTPMRLAGGDWVALTRRATQRDPLSAARQAARLDDLSGRFAEAVCLCLAGRLAQGRQVLADLAESPDAGEGLVVAAGLAHAWVGLLTGQVDVHALDRVADEAETLGVSWLTRMTRALRACAEDGTEVDRLRRSCRQAGDHWGDALIAFQRGMRLLHAGLSAADVLDDAAAGFDRLGAGVPASWAAAAAAVSLARDGEANAVQAALAAEERGRVTAAPIALGLAALALVTADPRRFGDREPLARAMAGELGLVLPVAEASPEVVLPAVPAGHGSGRGVALRCFGGFSLAIDGREVDCTTVKPRARAALHLLALAAGKPVHRETLVGALWPDVDARSGTRNLQVVVSALRKLLEPDAARGESALLVREGDAYRLALHDGDDVDLLRFEAGVVDRTAEGLEQALGAYAGELLPEDGPAEWVVDVRERYRLDAAGAARSLAELRLADGDAVAAAAAAERGLRIDRYDDKLWRLLDEAYTAAGNHAAANRARAAYDDVLTDLGVR
jgi:DNA-binding SARP family transcriptional activator